MSREITDINFEKEIASSDKIVLVDFWAPWCDPCLMQIPILEKLELEYDKRVKFLKINIDKNHLSASKYFVMSIPNCIFFEKGKPIEQVVGFASENKLKKLLNRVLNQED